MGRKKVTSTDIAKAAGVSQSTVSMVLNKKYNVSFSKETIDRVEEAAKELGQDFHVGVVQSKDSFYGQHAPEEKPVSFTTPLYTAVETVAREWMERDAETCIAMAKEYAPFVRKIEVETESLDMVREAVEAGADIIMLDNMDNATMKKAVEIIAGRAETECSGNVTKERLKEIAEIGVDYVSSGALTYGAPLLDLSLKNLHTI